MTPDELIPAANAVKALTKAVVTDEQIPDTAGNTRALEVMLANFRRGLVDEAGDHAEGDEYRIEDTNKGVRSYSPFKIIADYAEAAGLTEWEAVQDLVIADALRLSFMWSNLQMAANRARLDLVIHQGEIERDDAEHHVGVYYQTQRRVVARRFDFMREEKA